MTKHRRRGIIVKETIRRRAAYFIKPEESEIMTLKNQKILIITASVILVLALAATAVLVMAECGVFDKEEKTEGGDGVVHEPEEIVYDDDGNIKSRIYYENNQYSGRTDYYSKDKTDYEMTYDRDGNEIASRKTEHNAMGSVTLDQKRENGEITEIKEYTYYENMTTVKKIVTKTYDEGSNETAEKLYYSESGSVTRRSEFYNGELTGEVYYDEAGNEVEAPAESTDD